MPNDPRRRSVFCVLRSAFSVEGVYFFLLGLALRIAGLAVGGMTDLYQMLLDWGASVNQQGLARAFGINYGVLSYAAFGVAEAAAESVPRFWWAPYKVIVLLFDIGVLLALVRLVPRAGRTLVLVLFWVNPWFVLHEAYHGFWEGPHILFGLLAVLVWAAHRLVGGVEDDGSPMRPALLWATVGVLLMGSAMFKPHGLVHFIAPLGLYLAVQAWSRPAGAARARRLAMPFVSFASGVVAVGLSTTAAIWAAGGSPLAVVDNYRSAFATQLGVSNGGPGIWRFVAFGYMNLTGQTGHVAFVRMPRVMLASLTALAAVACLAIIVAFAWRVGMGDGSDTRPAPRPLLPGGGGDAAKLLLVLALGPLVLSQFGVRAHINHTYPALVLLIPFAAQRRDLLRLWVAMTVLLGVSHVLILGFGNAALLPPAEILHRYPAASTLIARVTELPAYRSPDLLMRVQAWANGAISRLPGETIVSLLSPAVFVLACLMVRSIFAVVKDSTGL